MHDDPIPNGDLKNQYEMLSDGKCEGDAAFVLARTDGSSERASEDSFSLFSRKI